MCSVANQKQLGSSRRTRLFRLASSLKDYAELVIEIRLHTQAYAEPDRTSQLSRERVVAIAGYLVGQGMDVKQLRARAFVSTQPVSNNSTEAGRRQNNRVELRVL